MKAIVLRLEAPLMSFGRVVVDNLGFTDRFPCASMLTGLLGNALGYDRTQGDRLDALQSRLSYAARLDRSGDELVDYQTADLGDESMRQGWTSRGAIATRAGGAASTGTHIRYRHFVADGAVTVVFTMTAGDPDLAALAGALQRPQRPLFIGRKPCLPSRPMFDGIVEAATLREALQRVPISARGIGSRAQDHLARWPASEGEGPARARPVRLAERRDWVNQVHVGEVLMYEGRLPAVGAS